MSIARFSRVSEGRFAADTAKLTGCIPVQEIPLPHRATAGSAGYDFVAPMPVTVPAGGTALIPTGIRCEMDTDWVLLLFPRSSLGFRYGIRLANTAGVIDSDYAHAENEGHIMVKLRNDSDSDVNLKAGERFCQGIFLPYGLAEEAQPLAERTGGMGSTGK